jgi:membrane-associated phospholipid phosphatase
MYFKHKFDRVRPNFLRKKINPSIKVPGHPAYPSGHATQAYTTALILGYLFPDKKSYYYKRGENVAKNREYAGVHYASDTVAGERIATYLLPIIVKKFNLKSKK